MRIISKFNDYYDSVLAYGHDDTYTYVRKTEDTKLEDERMCKHLALAHEMSDRWYASTPFVLGFCGKFYNGLRIQYVREWDMSFVRTFYSSADLEDYLVRIKDKQLRQIEMDRYFDLPARRFSTRPSKYFSDQFFDKVRPDSDDLFFKLGTPIFMYTKPERYTHKNVVLTTNPCLQAFEFYRVMPHIQAFQEIDQYLSGVLGQAHPPMIQVSDIIMRDKKGFNKYSFKTRPKT